MKRVILSFLMTFLFWNMSAQEYHVSTATQNKSVLIEEFTGVKCPNCPFGHRRAQELKELYGDRIYIVAIHCPSYSVTDEGSPYDLTVPTGVGISNLLGGNYGFFPSGSVNRRDWDGNGRLYTRVPMWEVVAPRVMAETAPVNLWAKAEFNEEKTELNIRVEGYYTSDIDGEAPYLNVYMLQDKILNMQSGGNMGSKYVHNHVLRDALTGIRGEMLPEGKKGTYFVKTYTYPVPEYYKEVPVNKDNLDMVAFVTQGYKNVLNTVGFQPAEKAKPRPVNASIHPYKLEIEDGYRYNFVQLVMKNEGDTLLTSAKFSVMLNDEAVDAEWTGELKSDDSTEVRLPVDWNEKAKEQNVYEITLKELNGKTVTSSSLKGKFTEPVRIPYRFVLEINTDSTASENTYQLCDMEGEVLKTFGPYAEGKAQKYEEELELDPDMTYCLEVLDEKGNGILPVTGSAIVLKDDKGLMLTERKQVNGFGYRLFFRTEIPTGIHSVVENTGKVGMVYNIAGKWMGTSQNLHNLPAGVYIVRSANGSEKILIR